MLPMIPATFPASPPLYLHHPQLVVWHDGWASGVLGVPPCIIWTRLGWVHAPRDPVVLSQAAAGPRWASDLQAHQTQSWDTARACTGGS